jgi:hypothetical protein
MADQSLTHADFRRAAALITHRADGSSDGIRYIIEEAGELNRTTPLLRCLIDGYRMMTTELRTEQALLCIGEFIDLFASQDIEPNIRRAATAIITHRDHDIDGFNAVLLEANADGTAGSLLSAVIELHDRLLPELSTPYGLKTLAQWTARIADKEFKPDEGGGSPS